MKCTLLASHRAYVENAGTFRIHESHMVNNTASYGGDFYVDADATLYSTNDRHEGCSATNGGGGVLYAAQLQSARYKWEGKFRTEKIVHFASTPTTQ